MYGRLRIGHGFDVHRLVSGRRLILAGVAVPHDRGLDGHSDADVLVHAVGDALLGALGAGDLGTYFPSSDARWRGASGAVLLNDILARVAMSSLAILNVDTTVIAQEPRLAPYVETLRAGLAAMLRLDVEQVNVKLKSTDRLGSIGRGEGIAAHAVALLGEVRGPDPRTGGRGEPHDA
jgi:2-C-methyl-D-erythritol 2,4-cyclodiphosphate synthase